MANAQMVQQGLAGGFGAPSLGMSPGANYMSLPGAQTMSDDGEAAPDGEIPADGKLDRPCASCRLSRVRCNRVFPCQRCVRLGLECKQPRKVQRGRPSHKARLARAQAQAQAQHEHHIVRHHLAVAHHRVLLPDVRAQRRVRRRARDALERWRRP